MMTPPAQCDVEISLNGKVLHVGPSGFPNSAWTIVRFSIPQGTLQNGNNKLRIANRHEQGTAGMPPMVHGRAVHNRRESFEMPRRKSAAGVLPLELPNELRPFPEPLPAGKQPGFKFRGIKGWTWTPEQYLSEIPVLVEHKMNFLMNCYASLFAADHWQWGQNGNRWWEPAARKQEAGS